MLWHLIVKSFMDPQIRLVENEQNWGLGWNWDKVLSCAEGEYVKLLGAAYVWFANASAGKQGMRQMAAWYYCAREISFDSVAGGTPRIGQMPPIVCMTKRTECL